MGHVGVGRLVECMPMCCPRPAANCMIRNESSGLADSVETLGNTKKAAISGGFRMVELRGIEPQDTKSESLTPALIMRRQRSLLTTF